VENSGLCSYSNLEENSKRIFNTRITFSGSVNEGDEGKGIWWRGFMYIHEIEQ
jgi:hypothetical protein